jgi:hypothetical protein
MCDFMLLPLGGLRAFREILIFRIFMRSFKLSLESGVKLEWGCSGRVN